MGKSIQFLIVYLWNLLFIDEGIYSFVGKHRDTLFPFRALSFKARTLVTVFMFTANDLKCGKGGRGGNVFLKSHYLDMEMLSEIFTSLFTL